MNIKKSNCKEHHVLRIKTISEKYRKMSNSNLKETHNSFPVKLILLFHFALMDVNLSLNVALLLQTHHENRRALEYLAHKNRLLQLMKCL